MRLFKGPRVIPGLAAILVFAALATPCAGANAVFWTGTGATNNISDPANWGGVAPAPGDSLNFLMGHPSVNIDVANASYSSVYISEGLPFTFSGNTMEITGVFLTATSVTFDNPVRLGPNFSLRFAGLSQSVIFSAGSSLTTEGGTISLGASGPPGTIDIQRDITETSPTAMTMIGAPGLPADIYIHGSNGMSGGVTVSSNANLHLGSLASLGSGVPQVWGTILLANPDSSELVIPNSLQLNAGGKLNLSGSGPFRLTGSINSQGGGVVSSVPVTLAGGIFGSFVVGPGAGPFDFQTVTTAPLFVNGTTAHIPASSWASVSVTNGGILRLDASSYDFNSGFTCDATSTIAMTLGGSVINAPSGGGCNFQLTIPPSLAIPASGFIPIAMWTNVQSGSFTSNANFAEGRAVNVNGTTMQVTYHGGYGSALGLVLPVGSGAPRPVTSLTTVTGLKDVSIARGTTKSNFIRAIAGAAGGPSANNQISFTILGGCGSFAGGASSVNVNTDVNGNAVAPSYTAPSNVTVCTVRASATGASGPVNADILVHVYNATTEQILVTQHDSVSLLQQLSVIALLGDGSGPMPGEKVRMSAPNNCLEGLDPPVDVLTDSNGFAVLRVSTADVPTQCAIQFTHVGGTATATENVVVYYWGDVVAVRSQSPVQAVVNKPISFSMTFAALGMPLANIVIHANVPSTGASATLQPSALVTDASGTVTFSGIANGAVGDYSIGIDLPGWNGAFTTPVHQVAAASTGPPFSPTGPTAPSSITDDVQDMWWAGIGENGWGMSLIQHGDTLFGALYVYDASGNPTWLVMPGGTWDSAHLVYSASLYEPNGSPFYAYDTTKFAAGNARGTIEITFQDANDAILEYTIDGISGTKFVTREIFANGSASGTNRSDLWWGGMSQNGWGIAVLQQASTLFAVWYTYDASGKPFWYVMPGGTWTAAGDTYLGTLYRTTGSPWLGTTYDPTKLDVINAGTYSFTFSGNGATFTYSADGHSGAIPLVREPF